MRTRAVAKGADNFKQLPLTMPRSEELKHVDVHLQYRKRASKLMRKLSERIEELEDSYEFRSHFSRFRLHQLRLCISFCLHFCRLVSVLLFLTHSWTSLPA